MGPWCYLILLDQPVVESVDLSVVATGTTGSTTKFSLFIKSKPLLGPENRGCETSLSFAVR
jgi:hypothetical protein